MVTFVGLVEFKRKISHMLLSPPDMCTSTTELVGSGYVMGPRISYQMAIFTLLYVIPSGDTSINNFDLSVTLTFGLENPKVNHLQPLMSATK